jgi:hypothetical protein
LTKLLERSLAGRDRLLLASDARLLVVLPTPKLEHDARLLYLLLEAFEGGVERLVLFDLDPRQNDPSFASPAAASVDHARAQGFR